MGADARMQKLNKVAARLRKTPTNPEMLLWKYLRLKQMEGFKFRRQQAIDNFIVDFVCFENRIIIEIDGGQHAEDGKKDIERDSYLKKHGFKVLRFWNNEVMNNIIEVLETIRGHCLYHPPLTPPVKGGESIVCLK